MDVENSQASLRFIKRIPPSGAAPSWKLTLSHKIVKERLKHLIDQPLQLAASKESLQTWEASIASRRNKDRHEYILQGWKLFAEAHDLRAHDQVAFELHEPRKLVVKCIKPAEPDVPLPSAYVPESVEPAKQHSIKVPNTPEIRSQSSRKRTQWPEEVPFAVKRSRSLQSAQSGGIAASSRCFSLPTATPQHPPGLAHRVQSWMSLGLHSPEAVASPSSGSRAPAAEPSELRGGRPMIDHISPEEEEETLFSDLDAELPGIFEDMCNGLDSVVPDAVPEMEPPRAETSALGSIRSSMGTPMAFPQHNPQVLEVQSRENKLRALVSSIQDRLDRSTRSALQATMGLENCVVEMTAVQTCVREAQAKMFRHLSTLKECLWQVLLVSNDSYDNDLQ